MSALSHMLSACWVIGILVVVGPGSADSAESRVALVIGNSAYQHVAPLANPVNDAQLMARTLHGLGFKLVGGGAQLNLDKASLDRIVETFGHKIQGAKVALFYYAGHGLQLGGTNYLIPVDANPSRTADADFQMLNVKLVLRQMEASGTRLNLVILDACRNNPFAVAGLRSVAGGLAQMQAPDGTLISFATQPGNVAIDGTDGHSPFTEALAKTIRKPGLGIFEVFNKVGLAVKRATAGSQRPWMSSSPIDGSFYFVRAPARPKLATQPNAAEIAWSVLKGAKDVRLLQGFVSRFPQSSHADNARQRIAVLEGKSAEQLGKISRKLKVRPLTAAQEQALKAEDHFAECDNCPEMVVVPAGKFTMGSPADEAGHEFLRRAAARCEICKAVRREQVRRNIWRMGRMRQRWGLLGL